MATSAADLRARAARIRLVLLDVDGVLTDGRVTISSSGDETKTFSIRDGAAIVWARRAGLEVGLLSGRPSGATTRRAAELGLPLVVQGPADKRGGYATLVASGPFDDEAVAYMGDDVLDLPILTRVGLSGAPADAVDEVRQAVRWVSASAGGRGAVREFLEFILRAQDKWEAIVQGFSH